MDDEPPRDEPNQVLLRRAMRRIEANWRQKGAPAFATKRGADGKLRIKHVRMLNVGDLEELAEHHVRAARRLAVRLKRTLSRYTAHTMAQHIVRARVFRAYYHELLGTPVDLARADMPLMDDCFDSQD